MVFFVHAFLISLIVPFGSIRAMDIGQRAADSIINVKQAEYELKLRDAFNLIGKADDKEIITIVRNCLQADPQLVGAKYDSVSSLFEFVVTGAVLDLPNINNSAENIFDRIAELFLQCAQQHNISLPISHDPSFTQVMDRFNDRRKELKLSMSPISIEQKGITLSSSIPTDNQVQSPYKSDNELNRTKINRVHNSILVFSTEGGGGGIPRRIVNWWSEMPRWKRITFSTVAIVAFFLNVLDLYLFFSDKNKLNVVSEVYWRIGKLLGYYDRAAGSVLFGRLLFFTMPIRPLCLYSIFKSQIVDLWSYTHSAIDKDFIARFAPFK